MNEQEFYRVDKNLPDISEAMRDIDFCMLATRAANGGIAARPMSTNREVEYEGTSWFFTCDHHTIVADIEREPAVGLSFQGKAGLKGLVGAPGMFIHVEGRAKLVRDKARFAEHWHKNLDLWFEQGIDTPGVVMIEVAADRIHYWDGMDEGEIKLTAPVA
jgi:general stress protein 26